MTETLQSALDELLTQGAKYRALMDWLKKVEFKGGETAQDLRDFIVEALK